MKTTISDFIIAFFDLLEAEVRAFKEGSEEFFEKEYKNFQKTLFKSSLSVLGIGIVGILFFISICAFSIGIYLFLNKFFSVIVSLFILSFMFLIFGFILLILLKKQNE